MDIRAMRPEKHRTAYVAWVDDDGDVSLDVVPVHDWIVVAGRWRPAFHYRGGWVWPQIWAERWPHRALVVAEPRAPRPTNAYLRMRAEGVRVPRAVEFVPGVETDDTARIDALEAMARLRAYPPHRDSFDPADPGWWLPQTDEEAQWADDADDALFTQQICAPRRRRIPAELGERTSTGNPLRKVFEGDSPNRSVRPVRTQRFRGNRKSP